MSRGESNDYQLRLMIGGVWQKLSEFSEQVVLVFEQLRHLRIYLRFGQLFGSSWLNHRPRALLKSALFLLVSVENL